jgi:hypothetical protein
MPLFVFRAGVAVAVPADYARDPRHQLLVDRLERTSRYTDAVAILDSHPDSFLAADILTGAPWAQRYLNTTARLSQLDPAKARRGLRALMCVLNGVKPRTGRHRAPPLTRVARGRADDVLARWRADIDRVWQQDRTALAFAVSALSVGHFTLSTAHRRALRALVRRKGLRRHDLVLTLTSWETGVPLRRLRMAQPVSTPELVYR